MFMVRLARIGRVLVLVCSAVLAMFGVPIIIDPPPRPTAAQIELSKKPGSRKKRRVS
jgi:hypothetical protein